MNSPGRCRGFVLVLVAAVAGCGGGEEDEGSIIPTSSDPILAKVQAFELSDAQWEPELERQLSQAFVDYEGDPIGSVTCVARGGGTSTAGDLATFECRPDENGQVFTLKAGEPGYHGVVVNVVNGNVTTVDGTEF